MLQSTHLTGISSPRFRRCSVGEEARVLSQKLFSLHRLFSKIGVSPVPSVSKAHLQLLGIQNFHTRALGVQESHGVDEHLALKECLAGLNVARVVSFQKLFFVHYSLQKAFEGRDFFWETGFKNRVKALLQSRVFFF